MLNKFNLFLVQYFSPHRTVWVFLFAVFSISLFYGYQHNLFLRPYSLHQWRQADCLSITVNYYKDNLPFFKPAALWQGEHVNGSTVSEFPIIYYAVAQLWKIFGQQEWIFRLIDLLIFYVGLFAFYKTCELIIKDSFWAFGLSLLLFSSPILAFYNHSFLSDVPAFSFSLIAWYFFVRYYIFEKKWNWIAAILLWTLAILLKASAAISLISIGGLFIGQTLFQDTLNKKVFKHSWTVIITTVMSCIIIYFWYCYAKYYNGKYNSGVFLIGILPIWDLTRKQINDIWDNFKWMPSYFVISRLFFWVLTSLMIFLLIQLKKLQYELKIVFLITLASFFAYILLFYTVFDVHDYYLINMMILPAVVFVCSIVFIKENYKKIYDSPITKTIFLIFLFFNITYCAFKVNLRYRPFNGEGKMAKIERYLSLGRRADYEFFNWFHTDYNNTLRACETVTPYIRSLGIQRNDLVISLPDQSFNISLYLMDQKGWTDFGYSPGIDSCRSKSIKQKIKLGAKYLIITNPELYKDKILRKYTTNKIGCYKNIDIFKLK